MGRGLEGHFGSVLGFFRRVMAVRHSINVGSHSSLDLSASEQMTLHDYSITLRRKLAKFANQENRLGIPLMNLEPLKLAITNLKPTGKDGFEGLLALALSQITRNPMRLAASGIQFGVDGQGEDRLNPVCFEAKRYSSNLSREVVLSKISDLGRRKNEAEILWVLGATVEVPNQLVQDLHSEGEEKGIATLVLDWNDHSLPSLAVMLSRARSNIAGWIAERTTASSTEDELKRLLKQLRIDEEAQARWEKLYAEFSASEISGRQAIVANKSWLETTLSSQIKAQSRFGQPTAPLRKDIPVLARETVKHGIDTALGTSTTCIVLGTEGVGKSWIAAKVALEFGGLSLILGAEKFEGINTAELEKLLAHEFATQTKSAHANITRWKRRLTAWEAKPPCESFLLVVDGINQRPAVPWDRILMILEGFVEDRGGKLLVTSRPRFFERHVQRGFDRPQKITVSDWSAGERNQVLSAADIDPSSLDTTTLMSLLNPRLLGIALSILPRDNPNAWKGLTVEGLLFEHIRRTQVDGFETQSPEDLCFALSQAAGCILDTICNGQSDKQDFVFESDLRSVKETRFFQSVKGPSGGYTLNEEGLSLALGFALIDRILSSSSTFDELASHVASLIEPIAALDQTSRIVLAALHICGCDPERHDPSVLECLVNAFCELQNLDDDAYPQFYDVVRKQPEAALSAAKRKLLEWRNPINERWLVKAVKQMFVSASTRPAVEKAISDWLRHMNTDARDQQTKFGRADEKDEEHAEARQQEINLAIASLSDYEREVFETCHIVKGDTGSLLIQSLELLAGEKLAPWAESLATLSFGLHFDHSINRAHEAFRQLTLFNRIDPVEAGDAFLEAAEPFRTDDTSPAGKWSLVRMLYATGHEDHSKDAFAIGDALRKELNLPDFHFSRLEQICATDPCDPSSKRPDNVSPTIQSFSEIETGKLLTAMGRANEDMDFEDALCAVSRFGPETAVAKSREFCRSILSRVGLPLRQLASCGTYLAPLLGPNDALELSKRLREGRGLEILPESEAKIVKCYMTMFAMHQLTGDEQLQLLVCENLAGDYAIDCIPSFKKPSEPAVLETLEAARHGGNVNAASSALSLVAHTYDCLSPKLAETIAGFSESKNQFVRAAVFQVALHTDNELLRMCHLTSSWKAPESTGSSGYESAYGSALLIDAVVHGNAKFEHILPRIAPESWYLAERRIGNDVTHAIVKLLDMRLRKAAEASGDLVSAPVEVMIKPNDHVVHSFRSIEERQPAGTSKDRLWNLVNPETDEAFQKRQKRKHKLFDEMESMLAEKDILLVVEQVDFDSFRALLADRKDVGLQWAQLLERLPDQQLPWFKDFALMIAAAVMSQDEGTAVRLLKRAIVSDAFVRRVFRDGLSIEHKAVWSCSASPAIELLWKERLTRCVSDDLIALEVLAAERFGAKNFILDFAGELMRSARPVDIALGVTIAGFSKQFSHFKPVLGAFDPSVGFIGRATKAARKVQDKALWTEHWVNKMWRAESPEGFWLNFNLAAKIIDARCEYGGSIYKKENNWHSFASLFTHARKERIKKWQKERAKTLYGSQKPNELFLSKGLFT